MIINVRGTSGTGKSTLIRRVMEQYPNKARIMDPGRKQPIGYVCSRPKGNNLGVVGHYETPCGGCDTIAAMDRIFELVASSWSPQMDIIFEGLLISADVNRTAALHHATLPLLVVALNTPIDVCIESINERRQRRNPDLPPVKEKNTISKYKGVQKSVDRLNAEGVTTFWGSRETAYDRIAAELGL